MNKFKGILHILFGFLLVAALVCLVVFISKNSKLAESNLDDSQPPIDLPINEEISEEITEDTVEIIEPDNIPKIQPDTSSDMDQSMDSDENDINESIKDDTIEDAIEAPQGDLTENNNSDEDLSNSGDSDDTRVEDNKTNEEIPEVIEDTSEEDSKDDSISPPIDDPKETNISISPSEELYKQCLTRVEYSQDPSSNYNIHKSISTIDVDKKDFMTTYLYFKEINHINGDLYLRFQYFNNEWVFTEHINIFVDNELVYDFKVNYNPKSNIAFPGGVSERITIKTDQEFHDLIENAIWYSDDVKIEFVGEKSSYTYSLQPTEIQAIRDVYIVWTY